LRSKLLANHEIEYFVEKAHKPPKELRGVVSDQFTFWHFESEWILYDWTLRATPNFKKVWMDFHVTGVTRATMEKLNEPDLLISKSKRKYTYERK
jgi:hypothetical protein